MKVDWEFTAETFLDQLPAREQARVTRAVQRLSTAPASADGTPLEKLTGDLSDLYLLRVGGDLRVLVRKHDDVITVVDVIRRSQLEGLRRLGNPGQNAAE